ncbi:M48 family metallopeptidase [Massilia sp. R2A-15]|uniref:M48 family metallopeptidase n=1 Tax=Massilia sp. R2A-15 TaxID=3064278 RepID=UPI002732DF08|nr:M48 family metallopeptidase [Massilia sp. R2A-15]WLI88077.1 M48 family metallopeptidase [Massilia sp. R2A-15]
MKRIDALWPAVTLALLMSGCATRSPLQQGPVPPEPSRAAEPEAPVLTPRMAAEADQLTKMATLQDRLYRVAAPLLINNAELCKTQARNLLGFTAKNRYSYPGEYNEAAHIAFGMGERLQVTGVLAGSGASQAGLRRGDRLVSAGGKALPSGPNASTMAGAVFGPLIAAHPSLPMGVERDGANKQLTIPVTRACGFGIELGNSDNINSYADGSRVMITRGMINFVRGDDELAYLLATGMAHNMLGHHTSQRYAGTVGGIIDNLVTVNPDQSMLIGSGGIKAMPADVDAAADRLAVYLLARAGYSLDGATAFWKRLASTYPASVLNGYVANHPATATRTAAIDKAMAEVSARQKAKKPLVPDAVVAAAEAAPAAKNSGSPEKTSPSRKSAVRKTPPPPPAQ